MNGTKLARLSILGGVLTLVAAEAAAEPTTYRVAAEESLLYVRLKPDASSLFSGLSHKHVIRASKVSGAVTWDPDAPKGCRVRLEIPVSGLVVDEPDLRKKLGFDTTLDEGDRKDVDESMRDEDQLDAEKHPLIRFEAKTCEARKDDRVLVVGDLEIRGQRKEIRVPMKVSFEDGGLRAQGEVSLLHRHFGFEPYSAGFGSVANDESLTFVIDVRARR